MPIDIRISTPAAASGVAAVEEAAFGRRNEARLVAALQARGLAVVDLVAVDRNRVVGHILFSPVTVDGAAPGSSALGLGPVAVAPDRQRQGIGKLLVTAGLAACRRAHGDIVVVLGHPEYYPRFGFRPAAAAGLRLPFPVPEPAFMVLELTPGSLARCQGVVSYAPDFADCD
ncbi:MAG: N-acetyltransferase [Candidatus Schekmanbacteria bacterium]|nr:N-acetyltransferase [Candidatus Schekmanbacteria bacterium]